MAILDQFGNSYYQQTAAKAAVRGGGQRPSEPVQLWDIGKLVPKRDRETLLSVSRRLYLNHPILSGAIEQKSMYAIGRAFIPIFAGADMEFGAAATRWLVETWMPICDIRGGNFDFKTTLYNASNAIDRDGEDYIYLTEDASGFPRIQHIPAHRIGNPAGVIDGVMTQAPYRNATIKDGIVYNRYGQPVAYAYLNEDRSLNKWLSGFDVVHAMDPQWQEMGRGLPAYTASLNMLRDALQSHEWEHQAQLMLSSIALIESNELGGPDPNDPMNALTQASESPTGTGITSEYYMGGQVRYFRSNSGGKLETLKNERPGESWESFQDRVIRMALAGVNWPYSLSWKPSGQGTAERHEIAKAQRAVEDRQDLLEKIASRLCNWAVAKAMKQGILPESVDWWKWTFSKPQKLTIDDGRVSKELIEGWKAGYINQADILGAHGKELRSHLYARAEEVALRKLIAEEIGNKYGVEIEEREMAMLTPNEMGGSKEAPEEKEPEEPEDDEEDAT